MKRIHIVGSSPRTGTTLLFEMMNACFDIDNACKHEKSICSKIPKSGNIYLTKHPGEISAVRIPLLLDNNLFVLCILRDPRDTVVSFHGSFPDIYWCSLRYWKLFVKIFDKISNNSHFVAIKYEDLVNDPNATQEKIMKHLPFLTKIHDFSEYHLHADPSAKAIRALKTLRPIDSKSIGNWKNHLPRIRQQIAVHGTISDDLIRFGYETDRAWEKCLEHVKIEHFETKNKEHFSLKYLYIRKLSEYRASLNILIRKLVS